MSPKILITGAFGQLGYSVNNLLSNKYDLILTDINGVNSEDNFVYLDITNENQISELLSSTNPDIIINLASYTDVDGCELNPEKAVLLNTNSIKLLLKYFDGKFIQISTDYVFDGNNGPYSEDDLTNPINIYGRTKLGAEKVIANQSSDWCILRTNVLFDYYKGTKASFVKWIIDSLNSNTKIKVVDDQWNNPIWTEKFAEVIELVICKNVNGLYHYGGSSYLNRYDFALMIADIFNLDENLIRPISTAELNQSAKRPLKGGLITNKIEQTLNIKSNKLKDSLMEIKSRML